MKYFLKLFFMLTVLLFVSTPSIAGVSYNILETSSKSEKFLEPVVKINYYIEDESGNSKIGHTATGFSVAYDKEKDVSYILTNAHVCEEHYSATTPNHFSYEDSKVILSAVSQYNSGDLTLIGVSATNDLCLLSTEGYIRPIKFADYDHKIKSMEKVLTVGAPLGVYPTASDGYITNNFSRDIFNGEKRKGRPLLFVSDIILEGHSGSPVFDSKGKVIGIISMSLKSPSSGVHFGGAAVSHQEIIDFLISNDVKY